MVALGLLIFSLAAIAAVFIKFHPFSQPVELEEVWKTGVCHWNSDKDGRRFQQDGIHR